LYILSNPYLALLFDNAVAYLFLPHPLYIKKAYVS